MFKNKKGIIETAVALYLVLAFVGGAIFWKPATSILGISSQPQKTQKSIIKKTESTPILYYTDPANGKQYVAYAIKQEESNIALSEESKLTLWQKIKNLGVLGIILVIAGLLWPPLGGVLWFVWKRITGTLKTAVENANTKIEEIQDKHEELTGDARLIVKSVDEGLATIDVAIAAANSSAETARQSLTLAAGIIDAQARASATEAAQHAYMVAQAVFTATTNIKKEFLSAMSRKQDSTTKLLVAALKND